MLTMKEMTRLNVLGFIALGIIMILMFLHSIGFIALSRIHGVYMVIMVLASVYSISDLFKEKGAG